MQLHQHGSEIWVDYYLENVRRSRDYDQVVRSKIVLEW